MKIKNLQLKNYRNYQDLDIDFCSGLNIFIGKNAQGKSNILESIFVLALTKSYMNIKDKYLIKDSEQFFRINAKVSTETVEDTFEVIVTDTTKKLKINGFELKKYCDYISRIKVLIFSPYNVNFVKDGPNVRRKSVNMVISQFSNNYIKALQNYNAILKKRNQFLKSIDLFNDYNNLYFSALNQQFCLLAAEVTFERSKFVEKVNQFLSKIYYEITDYQGLSFNYLGSMEIFSDKQKMIESFKLKLESFFDRERHYGMTLIGPHRDDFCFLLNDKELEMYGSQGQIRAAILSLKLSELQIFKEKDGDYPILLLDDIFSELDVEKRNRLVKYILEDVQTIITTTDINLIDSVLLDKSKIFVVDNGKVISNGRKEYNDE